jgi:hypothetical protein
MNRSSSFLAITSILAILLVASIAINNVEESSLRKPFPASAEAGQIGKVSVFDSLKESEQSNESEEQVDEEEELTFTPEEIDYFDNNFEGLAEVAKINTETQQIEQPDQNVPAETAPVVEEIPSETGDAINAELLRKVGFSNFFLQKKPFEKVVFDEFDFSELSSIEVEFYQVMERLFGNEKEILEIFHFPAADAAMTGEIYNLLKEKFKSELGVTINETNSFGLASFYINFGEQRENVFLVVKLKEGVYALSYPRGNVNSPGENKYFQSVKNLLNELLQQQ